MKTDHLFQRSAAVCCCRTPAGGPCTVVPPRVGVFVGSYALWVRMLIVVNVYKDRYRLRASRRDQRGRACRVTRLRTLSALHAALPLAQPSPRYFRKS